MISINDLDFHFNDDGFRLRISSLEFARGERTAIIGPSGTGKTTLLRLIAGITTPISGSVQLDGVEIGPLGDAARRDLRISRIGFVFQGCELLDYLNVLDNILLPYRINSSLRLTSETREKARGFMASMGLSRRLERRYVDRLSAGERQRVAVCRALITEPDVILADEPTGNLDPANKRILANLLIDHATRSKATLLVVTHDRDFLDVFDRVVDFKDFHHSSANENVKEAK